MTHAETWETLIAPAQHVVCGRELLPFSLGHRLLLRRISSPFVTPGAPPKLEDALIAVEICSRSFDDARLHVQSETLLADARARLDALAEDETFDAGSRVEAFNEYIRAHSAMPVFAVEREGAASVTPIEQRVMLVMMRDLGMSEGEALNRCWGLCLFDFVALMEMNGATTVIDRETERRMILSAEGGGKQNDTADH